MPMNSVGSKRPVLAGALVLLVGAIILLWYLGRPTITPESAPPVPITTTPPPYFEAPDKGRVPIVAPLQTPNPTVVLPVAPPPPAPRDFVPGGTAVPPEQMRTIFMAIGHMFSDFRTLAGENPVGTNAEIMKALMGDNKKGAILGPPSGMRLNADGELLDPWGTPYFFHQLSGQEMEIHSAGPDRKMWTDDDLVFK